ncbi:hypothetical protein PPROV_000432000 [Pycnococcus provasolii]|uniref:Cytoplasmic tRNA 2-thiolation protein 1 n=1 Tax=Pycnococcus provasolii TaxID=41880 RepID=A0A830HIE6_9CHLO|nr:hypothetical protein PPROV_000432000 [Pycnococcus provasolii]
MAPPLCSACASAPAAALRPATRTPVCRACFIAQFEEEVHATIVSASLFAPGDRVAIGASGGKDSTVLAYVLGELNKRHNYGIELLLLSIDEGIAGYRDDSLMTVVQNETDYNMPLSVVSYKQLYGWSMDEIVKAVGLRNNCTFCGVFRRQALDRGAELLGATKVATGHNADDAAETVLLNVTRGDTARLARCASASTGLSGDRAAGDEGEVSSLPRVKPLMRTYEKDIVLYARFNRLKYFSTECTYAPGAARGHVRDFVKNIERLRGDAVMSVVGSAEDMHVVAPKTTAPKLGKCRVCGYLASRPVCKACDLLRELDRKLPGRRAESASAPLNNSEAAAAFDARKLVVERAGNASTACGGGGVCTNEVCNKA